MRIFRSFVRAVTPPVLYQAIRYLFKSMTKKTTEAQHVNLALNHAQELAARFPNMPRFSINTENADAVLEFYNSILPLYYGHSFGSYLRSQFHVLRERRPELSADIERLIAISDMADGVPDRAKMLLNDPQFKSDLARQIDELEGAYGAKIVSEKYPNASRGASLILYFQAHEKLIAGKRVLHIAPEPELSRWLSGRCNYTTLDGLRADDVDVTADVTEMPFTAESFDLIICHRVLEHVLNDRKAFDEFFRILRPGGILNISVPQSVHIETTNEWVYPDKSHHGHVRQYGADLSKRMERSGFEVEPIDWLLKIPQSELVAASSFPMRLYNASRPTSRR
jgi:Methyltransferase domain